MLPAPELNIMLAAVGMKLVCNSKSSHQREFSFQRNSICISYSLSGLPGLYTCSFRTENAANFLSANIFSLTRFDSYISSSYVINDVSTTRRNISSNSLIYRFVLVACHSMSRFSYTYTRTYEDNYSYLISLLIRLFFNGITRRYTFRIRNCVHAKDLPK